jgi:hypothetical protein
VVAIAFLVAKGRTHMEYSVLAPTSQPSQHIKSGGCGWGLSFAGGVIAYVGANLAFMAFSLISFPRLWGEGGDPTLTQSLTLRSLLTLGVLIGLPAVLIYSTIYLGFGENHTQNALRVVLIALGAVLLPALFLALIGAFIAI